MTTQLRFRTAAPDDARQVVELVESAYRGDASRAGWTTEADLLAGPRTSAEEVARSIAADDTVVLLAEEPGTGPPADGRMVGCCRLRRAADGRAYFGMFAVRPGLQGRGLGRALLAEAERTVVERWDSAVLGMQVLSVRDELIAWYERHGYRRTGETVPFSSDVPDPGALRDDLVFETLEKRLPAVPVDAEP